MSLLQQIKETKNYIMQYINIQPKIGLVLGSGLGVLANEIENKTVIEYKNIPNFPKSTVKGHKGQLVIGKLNGKKVIAMQGRFHYYEGYTMKEITFPIRVMNELGINKLIITNAAGGINEDFKPGDLMIINDHINFVFDNPLIGKHYEELGDRFPDMSYPYSEKLISLIHNICKDSKINIKKGCYAFLSGPSYETPAEIKMLSILGADAVGMSTVPEVMVGVNCGMEILGVSCITNMASGILEKPLDHKEVLETTKEVKHKFIMLIKSILKNI